MSERTEEKTAAAPGWAREMLSRHRDITVPMATACLSGPRGPEVAEMLERGDVDGAADACREHALRELVSSRVREVVRKKPGGGGYVLYSPNRGKKKQPKAAGTFPTKLGAKRAELARFPPRDPAKLERLRKQVARLMKDPGKRADAERREKEPRHEALLRAAVRGLLREALFHEEAAGSQWDERLSRLSKRALADDPTLQRLQGNIGKKTEQVLQDAFRAAAKAARGVAMLRAQPVKHSQEQGKTYLAFTADVGGRECGPFFVYAEHGVPRIEVSTGAKTSLMKADPELAKRLRAELVTVQERVLDRTEDLVRAVAARDKYLSKLEDGVDAYVAGLSPLEVSVLKSLLVSKYRKA